MLADEHSVGRFGALRKDVHKPSTFFRELLQFIAENLPAWRDRPERRQEESEQRLTSQLCAHLNSAARLTSGWDVLQFRTEEPDETARARKLDLAPAPAGVTIHVAGRSYNDFDALLPIECKRLPTPIGKDRDEREYVFSQHTSTGGIQRFKDGSHGASHVLGAMIGFVQAESVAVWDKRIAQWIHGLIGVVDGWSKNDLLSLEDDDSKNQLARLRSSHTRPRRLDNIELCHLWVRMR